MSCGYLKLNCTRGVESEILLLHKFVAIFQLVNLAVLKPYMEVGYFVYSSRLYVAQLAPTQALASFPGSLGMRLHMLLSRYLQ